MLMNAERTVFTQILDHMPRYEFNKCVKRYHGNHRVRRFPCYDQFLCLAFAQLTYRESLRDIETCLNSHREKLYQKEELAIDLDYALYAFDSTTIDLCLSLFPWAHFRKTKAAIKLHTFLDLRGSIPTFISLTPGNIHDVKILDILPLEKDSVIAMDRGYIDFTRLYTINLFPAFFVIRAKSNLQYSRLYSQEVDKTSGLRADQRIVLTGKKSRTAYPDVLRRVSYVDPDSKKRFVYLTNIFTVPAKTVADIYKQRWQVEIFFRWIKQHLRVKTFYGTSPNAVKTQIWIAISIYLLVAILKKRLHLPGDLHSFLQILEVNIFERRPIIQIVNDAYKLKSEPLFCNQLNLFNS
jgi:transposase